MRKSALIAAGTWILLVCLAPVDVGAQALPETGGGGGSGGLVQAVMTMSGVTNGQILVGQMMTAKVEGQGVTNTNYRFQWSLSGGGNPFASWSVSPVTSSAPVMVDLAATDSLSLSCFFSQAATVTVGCTITPIGNAPPVTLTPSSINVTVVKPGGQYISKTSMQTVAQLSTTPGQNNDTIASVDFWAQGKTDNGINMSGSAVTPSPFSGGGWNYWQTINQARHLTCAGGPPIQYAHWSTNGSRALDSELPAEGGNLQFQGNVSGNPPLAAFPADGTMEEFGDSPGVDTIHSASYTEIQVLSLTNAWTLLGYSGSYGDSFDTYQMYCPPNCGTQATCYVPLQVVEWTWMADATCDTSNPPVWTLNSSSAAVTGTLAFPPFSDWPTWTQNVNSGYWATGR